MGADRGNGQPSPAPGIGKGRDTSTPARRTVPPRAGRTVAFRARNRAELRLGDGAPPKGVTGAEWAKRDADVARWFNLPRLVTSLCVGLALVIFSATLLTLAVRGDVDALVTLARAGLRLGVGP